MYVMTEDNKILNLNHFFEIQIVPSRDEKYLLQARYHKGDNTPLKNIAGFEDKEQAELALMDLFQRISEEDTTWSAINFKKRGEAMANL